MASDKEMSFLDHLEELRWHLMRSFIAIGIFFVIAFSFPKFFFDQIILAPSKVDFVTFRVLCELGNYMNSQVLCIEKMPFSLINRNVAGQFTMHLSYSFVFGLVCAFPYLFWEIWRFVRPALLPDEQKISSGATFFVSLLFAIGVLFGYYVITPLSINFLANYQVSEQIDNQFDISSYVSTVCILVLACGVMFQLPVVIYFLSKVGLVTPQILREYRRYAIVVILFVGAIITPPDVMSQLLVSIPIMFLYEVSIFLSGFVVKQEAKKEKLRVQQKEAEEKATKKEEVEKPENPASSDQPDDKPKSDIPPIRPPSDSQPRT